MFEISQLKAKKLPELQEIAKQLKVPKYRSLKKLDLVYQILDYQAANPAAVKAVTKEEPEKKVPVLEQPIVQPKPKITEDAVNDYIKQNPDLMVNYLRNERAMKAQRKQMNARSLLNNAF